MSRIRNFSFALGSANFASSCAGSAIIGAMARANFTQTGCSGSSGVVSLAVPPRFTAAVNSLNGSISIGDRMKSIIVPR